MHKSSADAVAKGESNGSSGGAKVLGHAVHPMVIVFPLGLLSAAVIFEGLYYIYGNPTFAIVAYWMTIAGIIGGIFAAIFGWIDWFAIKEGTRAKSVGLAHGGVNTLVLATFALGLYFRYGREADPPTFAFIVALLGAGLALVGGWLGGELVERLGIGVHKGANADAPSSLVSSRADRPIDATPREHS
ncbi:hypothetical protein BH24ACI3_BH24ACI3_04810 [soil metagenome]